MPHGSGPADLLVAKPVMSSFIHRPRAARPRFGRGLALPLAFAGPAVAEPGEARAGAILASRAWARATPPGAGIGGGYVTIRNAGDQPDRLVGFSSPAAARGELHEMSVEGGVMRMRPVPSLEIAPGETVVMKPGGLHLMLMELKAPLRQGEPLRATLRFERAGPLELEFSVARPGAPGPEDGAAMPEDKAPAGHDHRH